MRPAAETQDICDEFLKACRCRSLAVRSFKASIYFLKGLLTMGCIGFILEHTAKILDWTNDDYEAAIIREIASYFDQS